MFSTTGVAGARPSFDECGGGKRLERRSGRRGCCGGAGRQRYRECEGRVSVKTEWRLRHCGGITGGGLGRWSVQTRVFSLKAGTGWLNWVQQAAV